MLVDRAKTSGDAVTPADPGVPGVLLYRACDFGDGVAEIAVTASGTGEVTFFAADGTTLAGVVVGPTDGPYAYATVAVACRVRGVTDLRVELRGRVRLAHVACSG